MSEEGMSQRGLGANKQMVIKLLKALAASASTVDTEFTYLR
jgi:hypothetical protein